MVMRKVGGKSKPSRPKSLKKKGVLNEVEKINAQITTIFKKHKIKVMSGEEGFWEGVNKVQKLSLSDARKLTRLANHWAVAMTHNLERSL